MSVSLLEKGVAERFAVHPSDMMQRPDAAVVGPRELLTLLRRRKVLILSIVTAGTLLSFIASMVMPESYTASSTIVLQQDDPNLLEATPEPRTQAPNPSKMDTETDLMRSRVFAGRVVDELNLIADPGFNTYLSPLRRISAGPLDARPASASLLSPLVDGIGGFFSGKEEERRALPPAQVQRDRAISALLSRLAITRAGESLAMTVTMTSGNPRMAATLANTMTSLYVAWSRDLKRDDVRSAVEFLRQQSSGLALRIATLENQIADYGRDEKVSSDPRDDLLRAAMGQANEQLSAARGELTQAQARLAQVKAHGADASASAGEDPLLASAFLTTLRGEEATAQRERAQLARNLGANHPLIREADAKIASVRALIGEEMGRITANLDNDVRVAEGRVAKIEKDLAASNEQLRQRSRAEIRLRELNRDLLTEQKLYDVVSARLGELNPYSDIAKPGARVVSVAETPLSRSAPKTGMLVGCGFAASLAFAVVIAMTRESLDMRVRSARRVAEVIGAPVIASVPEVSHRPWERAANVTGQISRNPRSAFAESFRSVLAACRRANAGRRQQVVMVCSGLPSEGATTTAVGLAVAAASDGVRTVLVDLDMRTGGLRRAMGLHLDDVPLESYLRGRSTLRDVAQLVPGVPNLDVMLSASSSGRGAELLDPEVLAHFVTALRGSYDLVVIDVPPLLMVSDADAVAPLADAVVLVSAYAAPSEEELSEIAEHLRVNEIACIGVVVNRIDAAAAASGGFRGARAHRRTGQRYFTA